MAQELNYLEYRRKERAAEVKRLTQVLRETHERRFAPDDAVEGALNNLETEITLLIQDLARR